MSGNIQFFLVAHSYGCAIALELAALLEEDGLVGTLILIDGAPESLLETVKVQFGTQIGRQFEVNVLENVLPYLVPTEAIPFIAVNITFVLHNIHQLFVTLFSAKIAYIWRFTRKY